MGGFGSGKSYGRGRRKRGRRNFVSWAHGLNISNYLKRQNEKPGYYQWDKIRLHVKDDHIHLVSAEEEGLQTNTIKIAKLPCNYGGCRFFGHCPYCNRRVTRLYFLKGYFACRHCYRMSYYVQNATLSTRLVLKSFKIGKMINENRWNKPKWMRWKTFNYLRKQYFDLDEMSQLADLFSLRNIRQVKKMFKKYPMAIFAAEDLEAKYYNNK